MRLLITTPLAIVVDEDGVTSLRTADETGFYGLNDRHADFVTATELAVVSYRDAGGRERYCATGRGVLTMHDGREVHLAVDDAVPGDDLDQLEGVVLENLRERAEDERKSREEAARMELAAMRRMFGILRPDSSGVRLSVAHEDEA